jgi:hypothetical protein
VIGRNEGDKIKKEEESLVQNGELALAGRVIGDKTVSNNKLAHGCRNLSRRQF